MATVRLAPGVVLVTVPDRGLAVRTPDGTFLRVDTGGLDADTLVARLTSGPAVGDTRPDGIRTDPSAEARLDALADAFEAAGYAVPAGPAAPRPLAGRTVVVLGDRRLTGPLARCLRDEGGEVREGDTVRDALDGDPAVPTAVVWCLDGPVPPGLWDDADRLLPAHGVGWLRCHREGALAWIEPLAAGPGDVTSAGVRLRRLAATPAHRELAAYWDGRRTPDDGPAHTAASAALTAALLTGDLIAWAGGAPVRTRRRLRRLDLRDLTVTEHPVLPVPAVAPLPVRAAAAPAEEGARW
ncbi:hypothetical protein [Streptomyces sp. SP18CS02]|uniref:hypothetical protein n=1 Tax=Streptomyces sp. SP18CS02 TaxID=3002531 RepID=UPI002E76942C|nr:hypothetical protein [Streptomyces sp. SP18CS02]MEE1756615.1 hypothetical protein [Streptomyces sp. SP18CS02]